MTFPKHASEGPFYICVCVRASTWVTQWETALCIDVCAHVYGLSKNVLAEPLSRRMINKEPFVKEAAQIWSLCETMMLNGPKLLPEKHKALPPLNPALSCSSFPETLCMLWVWFSLQWTVMRPVSLSRVTRDVELFVKASKRSSGGPAHTGPVHDWNKSEWGQRWLTSSNPSSGRSVQWTAFWTLFLP